MADGFQAAREKAVSPGTAEEPGRAPGAEMRAAEDEETQPEGEGEMSRVKLLSVPVKPSQKLVDEHEASGHAVFRNWCGHCVASWGLAQKHLSVEHGAEEVPTVSSDFFYMGEEDETAPPFLVVTDRRTKSLAASALPNKKVKTLSNVRFFGNFLKSLGYPKVVNKSDGEPALMALKTEAAKHAGIEAVPKESPAGDHQANGEAENAVKEVKRRIRAIRGTLETKRKEKIKEDHPILTWMPQHAAAQINRFKVLSDGRTSEQRRTGQTWRKQVPLFGDQIMIETNGDKEEERRRDEDAERTLHRPPQLPWIGDGNDDCGRASRNVLPPAGRWTWSR